MSFRFQAMIQLVLTFVFPAEWEVRSKVSVALGWHLAGQGRLKVPPLPPSFGSPDWVIVRLNIKDFSPIHYLEVRPPARGPDKDTYPQACSTMWCVPGQWQDS